MDKLFQFVTSPIRWLLQNWRQNGVQVMLTLQMIWTFKPQAGEYAKANREIQNDGCTIEKADVLDSSSKGEETKEINDDSEVFYSASDIITDCHEQENSNCATSNEGDMPHSQSEDQDPQGVELEKDVSVGEEMLISNNVSKSMREEENTRTEPNIPLEFPKETSHVILESDKDSYVHVNEDAETLVERYEHSEDQMQNVSETVPEEEDFSFTPLELFASLMNERFKGNDGLKVFVTHSEQDTELAKFLSKYLRERRRFRAVAQDDINAELRVNTVELKTALDWADVVVKVISNKWLEECNNIAAKIRSTESLNTRYLNTVSRSTYVSEACLNCHLVPVVRKGTNKTYKEHPELREAIDISDLPLEDELNNIGNKIIACALTGKYVREFMDKR